MNCDKEIEKIYKSIYASPLGNIEILSDGENVISLAFGHNNKFTNANEDANKQVFIDTKKWLDDYFKGQNPDKKNIRIKLIGTNFQKEVWDILNTIPYGKKTTYGDIAKRVANNRGIKKMSSQAVGNAIHNNPIAIIIPCHRVLSANDSLTGYASGLDKKKYLLDLESIKYNE